MENYNQIMLISADIYSVVKSMNNIGWNAIRESSINRILYLSAVMYSFMETEQKNIFSNDYSFVITIGGPEDPNISNAITNLESNEVIERNDTGFALGRVNLENTFNEYPLYTEKKKWIDDMLYIIGIYGEDKIYDFVFRDPQYQLSLKTNAQYVLDLTANNATVNFLNSFKNDFENQAKKINQNYSLNNRQYLSMYFEFVFGKILRGDLS